MCLSGSLSCGDSSDVQFASASQSVLPSIAFQDFIFAHLWPHAFSGDKRTDADQATVVEWIVYDQRNEKRVCMNATSRSHLTVGWSGEGSYLSVHVFDHRVNCVWSKKRETSVHEQFGCSICFSLTISLAIDRISRFYLCSPVTPCLFRWQKNRRWSSDSCRVNCVWSKKRETSVHERDEYLLNVLLRLLW